MRRCHRQTFSFLLFFNIVFLSCLPLLSVFSLGYQPTPVVWLEAGSYVEYRIQSQHISFTNLTDVDYGSAAVVAYRWQCMSISGNEAVLNVTSTIQKNGAAIWSRKIMINVNLNSSAVTLQNGTFVGTLQLWSPPRLDAGTSMAIPTNSDFWFGNYSIVSLEFKVSSVDLADTLQGTLKSMSDLATISYRERVGNETMKSTAQAPRVYGWETGLLITFPTDYDVTLLLLGIVSVSGTFGGDNIYATNISLGPAELSPYNVILTLTAATLFLAMFIVIYRRRRRARLVYHRGRREIRN